MLGIGLQPAQKMEFTFNDTMYILSTIMSVLMLAFNFVRLTLTQNFAPPQLKFKTEECI